MISPREDRKETPVNCSVFDRVTRLLASPAGRRAALAATATRGLTALTAGTAAAQRGNGAQS
jgi:hypothetical protein